VSGLDEGPNVGIWWGSGCCVGVERVYAGGASVGVVLILVFVLRSGCDGGEDSRDWSFSLSPPQTCALDFKSSFDIMNASDNNQWS
jgi:hypothetical protein